jgi:cell division protein ZapB
MTESDKFGVNNNRKVLIIIVFLILVVINGIQFYMSRQNEQKNKELIESKNTELITTYSKLDSISRQLNEKIQEIGRLGGNIDSLIMIKEQLEKEKDELKLARSYDQDRYNKIREKIEGYEFLLKRKDQEIAKLKEVNQELLSENINLKSERNDLSRTINTLQEEKGEMAQKISVAAALRAENIKFYAVNRRGKPREGEEFKTNQIDELRVSFNLGENSLAQVGAKTIIMRIIEPEGSALYNAAAGSGTFMFKNEEIFYTASKEILFDNTQQIVTFEYEKGSEFRKGQHKVELYAEGALIGAGYFVIR